jgi:hypothetical protein
VALPETRRFTVIHGNGSSEVVLTVEDIQVTGPGVVGLDVRVFHNPLSGLAPELEVFYFLGTGGTTTLSTQGDVAPDETTNVDLALQVPDTATTVTVGADAAPVGFEDRTDPNPGSLVDVTIPGRGEPELSAIEVSVGSETIQVGDTTPITVTATDSDGNTEEVTGEAEVSVDDTTVATVPGGDTLRAEAPGPVLVSAQYFDEVVERASTAVTVRPAPASGDPGGPLVTGSEFTIPLSIFGDTFLFESVPDVTLTIPQLPEITNTVAQVTPDLTQISTAVETEVNGIDIPEPPTPDEIATAVTGEITLPEVPSLEDIGAEVLSVLDGAVSDAERGFADVLEGAEDAADGAVTALEDTIAPAVESVQTTVDGIQEDINGLPDDIATTGDLAFASLQDDVEQLQTDIENLSFDPPEPDFPAVPTAEDITGAIEEELVPTVEGVSVLDDPVGFLAAGGEEALAQVLTAETQARLREVS